MNVGAGEEGENRCVMPPVSRRHPPDEQSAICTRVGRAIRKKRCKRLLSERWNTSFRKYRDPPPLSRPAAEKNKQTKPSSVKTGEKRPSLK